MATYTWAQWQINDANARIESGQVRYPAGTTVQRVEDGATLTLTASGFLVDGAGNSRKKTIVLFGDSRTADCNYRGQGFDLAYSTNMSWWDWGAALTVGGPPLDVIANSGVSGSTTAHMLARFSADVLAYAPGYMTMWGGTNDSWTTTADVDVSFGRMTSMIDQAASAGIYVFVISETPASTKSVTFPPLVAYYNDRLRQYVQAKAGVEFWDFASIFTDPASANGYPKTALTRDGLHLSPLGASVLGRDGVAPRLSRLLARVSTLVSSVIDTRGAGGSASSTNLFPNPLMGGAVTATGTNQSGTLPTGWVTSGQTAVMSTPARADDIGNDLQCILTAASSGSFFATLTASPQLLVPGKRYVLEGSLTLSGLVNVSAVSVTADCSYSGAGPVRRGIGYPTIASAVNDTIADGAYWFRSRVFTAPEITYLGLTCLLRVGFAGAGSATVKLGRLSLKEFVD